MNITAYRQWLQQQGHALSEMDETTIVFEETTQQIAARIGWGLQTPQGWRWLRRQGSDLYVLVDVLADRLREQLVTEDVYPDWALNLSLPTLFTLLEVDCERREGNFHVKPVKRPKEKTDA